MAARLKVYDPFITKDVVENQYHNLDAFLADVDMVVVMVKHTEIRENVDKLAGKLVLDCHNIINLPGRISHLKYDNECCAGKADKLCTAFSFRRFFHEKSNARVRHSSGSN